MVRLMTQQLVRCDVNEADEAEQRRLERHPEFGHAGQCLSELGWRRTVNTCPMACQWRLRGLLLGGKWPLWPAARGVRDMRNILVYKMAS